MKPPLRKVLGPEALDCLAFGEAVVVTEATAPGTLALTGPRRVVQAGWRLRWDRLLGRNIDVIGSWDYDMALIDSYDLRAGRWLDWAELVERARATERPLPPVVMVGGWDPQNLGSMLRGRVGVVVRPLHERTDPHYGRVIISITNEGT